MRPGFGDGYVHDGPLRYVDGLSSLRSHPDQARLGESDEPVITVPSGVSESIEDREGELVEHLSLVVNDLLIRAADPVGIQHRNLIRRGRRRGHRRGRCRLVDSGRCRLGVGGWCRILRWQRKHEDGDPSRQSDGDHWCDRQDEPTATQTLDRNDWHLVCGLPCITSSVSGDLIEIHSATSKVRARVRRPWAREFLTVLSATPRISATSATGRSSR